MLFTPKPSNSNMKSGWFIFDTTGIIPKQGNHGEAMDLGIFSLWY